MFTKRLYVKLVEKTARFSSLRPALMKLLESITYRKVVTNSILPKKVAETRYNFFMGLVKQISKNKSKGYIKDKVIKRISDGIAKAMIVGREKKNKKICKKYNLTGTPGFLVVSPTKKCNLQCIGCYASSNYEDIKLNFKDLDRLVHEAHKKFGQSYMVISGGEPLLYNDNGKTLFDIWKKYPKMIFMFYTNGTLITKEVAKKMAKLGNVSPAISVEGYEKETDCRRGKGVYKKILEAMDNLKQAGVPFGVSVTATSKNINLLLKDEMYKYWFDKVGASYMWMFQLMPIGKAKNAFKLMITPEHRVKLFKQWEKMLSQQYPVADFWNSGMIADGCVAYGRKGGYVYINWDGKIMPCAFVPYYIDNLKDLYAKGKSLADALGSNFFRRGRQWQREFTLNHMNKPGNLMMPCSIRDHYKNWKENILTPDAKPENQAAADALHSKAYEKVLENFDKKLEKITTPMWKKKYLEEGVKKKTLLQKAKAMISMN